MTSAPTGMLLRLTVVLMGLKKSQLSVVFLNEAPAASFPTSKLGQVKTGRTIRLDVLLTRRNLGLTNCQSNGRKLVSLRML